MAIKKRKMRGARPSPRARIMAVPLFTPGTPPPQLAVVPPTLSMWGNDQYGDCVSAEEAFSKAAWSLMCGLPELFIPEKTVTDWARRHGFINGADLLEVMDAMLRDGFIVEEQQYDDGPYMRVDYSNPTQLKAAIATGPVKIGIDANALPNNAGDVQGWFALHEGDFSNEDHCVALCGYGSGKFLYEAMKVPLPTEVKPDDEGFLLFTWSTIGFVSHKWLMSCCYEAYVRNPTTPGQAPTPAPDPSPTPTPTPTPPSSGNTVTITQPLAPGVYPIGVVSPGVDPAKLMQILELLAELLGVTIDPVDTLLIKQTIGIGPIPWQLVMQIIALIMQWLNPPTPHTAIDRDRFAQALRKLCKPK